MAVAWGHMSGSCLPLDLRCWRMKCKIEARVTPHLFWQVHCRILNAAHLRSHPSTSTPCPLVASPRPQPPHCLELQSTPWPSGSGERTGEHDLGICARHSDGQSIPAGGLGLSQGEVLVGRSSVSWRVPIELILGQGHPCLGHLGFTDVLLQQHALSSQPQRVLVIIMCQ